MQDIDEASKETWREYATYRVGDFFEALKEQYRSLEAVRTFATLRLFEGEHHDLLCQEKFAALTFSADTNGGNRCSAGEPML